MSQQQNVAQTTFAERLNKIRTIRGLSMRELGRKAGIDVGYISRLEQGLNDNLGPDKAAKLSQVLSVTVDWLLTGRPGVTPAQLKESAETGKPIAEIERENEAKMLNLAIKETPTTVYSVRADPCPACASKDKEIEWLRSTITNLQDNFKAALAATERKVTP